MFLASFQVVRLGTDGGVVLGENLCDVQLLSVRNVERLCLVDERVEQALTGVVPGITRPAERLGPKVPLVDIPLVGGGEIHAPLV
jgi:hypothetical protein